MPVRPERSEVGRIALVCHAALAAYRTHMGGEKDVLAFDREHEQHKALALKLAELLIANPGLTAAMLHKQWCMEMVAAGWSYGLAHDAQARTHPAIRDWRTLPEYDRRKGLLAVAIVQALTGFT